MEKELNNIKEAINLFRESTGKEATKITINKADWRFLVNKLRQEDEKLGLGKKMVYGTPEKSLFGVPVETDVLAPLDKFVIE